MTDMNNMPHGSSGQQSQQTSYQNTYGAAQPQQPQQPQQQPQPQQSQQPHAYSSPAYEPAVHTPKHSQPKKSGAGGIGKTFVAGFLGALIACVLAFGAGSLLGLFDGGSSSGPGVNTTLGAGTDANITADNEDPTLAEAVAAKALPSVVAIDVFTTQSTDDIYSLFMYGSGEGNSGELTQSSLGSGVVLSKDGYIITNYHVIQGAEVLQVTVEGATYEAEIVGTDASSDIAVIKAKNATDLKPIELGDSDNLTIGEWVMSIGSPFGLEQSVATGIVSATSRSQVMNSSADGGYGYGFGSTEYTYYPNMIQTDAAINPGNSGGALVNADGKLIGINTLITSYSGNYSGVGFAIPVNYAIQLAEQIIDGDEPTHAQLGVSITTVNKTIAQRYDFKVDEGAYVSAVTAGSGAEEAGLQEGDIITAFDGMPVASASDLMLDIRTKNPGDTVKITFNRDGETKEVDVVLGSDAKAANQQQSYSLF